MTETGAAGQRFVIRLFVLGMPLVMVVADGVALLVTYVVAGRLVPDDMGRVAQSPLIFAVLVALVRLPMGILHTVAVAGRPLWMAWRTGDIPDRPERHGWRRVLTGVRDRGFDLAAGAVAALIVFDRMAEPGVVRWWPLVAITALGPWALHALVTGFGWLVRRWWRRNRSTYRPATPTRTTPGRRTTRPAVRGGGTRSRRSRRPRTHRRRRTGRAAGRCRP